MMKKMFNVILLSLIKTS